MSKIPQRSLEKKVIKPLPRLGLSRLSSVFLSKITLLTEKPSLVRLGLTLSKLNKAWAGLGGVYFPFELKLALKRRFVNDFYGFWTGADTQKLWFLQSASFCRCQTAPKVWNLNKRQKKKIPPPPCFSSQDGVWSRFSRLSAVTCGFRHFFFCFWLPLMPSEGQFGGKFWIF